MSQRRRIPWKTTVAAMAAAGALAACGGSDTPSTTELRLNVTGLEDLGATAVYEGWLMVNGAPVSTGRFSVNAQGVLSKTSFDVLRSQADAATAFILTIEPAVGDVAAPADTHLIAGSFDANRSSASLSIAHPAALGDNFGTAMGEFILATPSSATMVDDGQGLWFLCMNENGGMEASLNLPDLPSGWAYEGWVVVDGVPISTGTFTRVDAADSDGAGPTAGPGTVPPFPGQDFITPAVNLGGRTVVVSIEPQPDNSPAPFALKPLLGVAGTLTGPQNPHALTNTVGDGTSLPRGTAVLVR